jgi:hypothetical protein
MNRLSVSRGFNHVVEIANAGWVVESAGPVNTHSFGRAGLGFEAESWTGMRLS